MKELFNQIVMRLALCGLAASFAVLVFRSWPVRAALARLSAIWRGLTAFGRFAVCAFLFVGVLEADKTNNVNNLPPQQMMAGGGSFLTGFTGLTGLPFPIPHSHPALSRLRRSLRSGDTFPIANPVQTTPPQQTFASRLAANWNVCGAWKDSFWLDFEAGWVFPHGTNHLSGVEVVSQGMVWPTPFDANAVASIGEPVEIVPGLSSFGYELTPSNTYRFVWSDAAINRDTNNLVSAALELFRNGDVMITTNGVVAVLPRELPFPHSGFGQDDEWVATNFTNATEILAVGYPQWVDTQVGEGLTNGLYKFTTTIPDDPPETIQLVVGDYSVAVTNSGEYVFLLEKGSIYPLSVFPKDFADITYSADAEVPILRGRSNPPMRGGLGSPQYLVHIVATGDDGNGVEIIEPTADADGYVLYWPRLLIAPGILTDPMFPVLFHADVFDIPINAIPSVTWEANGQILGTGENFSLTGEEDPSNALINVTAIYKDVELHGTVRIEHHIRTSAIELMAGGLIIVEEAYTNVPGEVVAPIPTSAGLSLSWSLAEAGTLVLDSDCAGIVVTNAYGTNFTLPHSWHGDEDEEDEWSLCVSTSDAYAQTGGSAAFTFAFIPDEGGNALARTSVVQVVKVRVVAAADWPSNKVRHVFGPKERFAIQTTPQMSLSVCSNSYVGVSGTSVTAPDRAGVFSVMLTSSAGSHDLGFTCIAPTGLLAGNPRGLYAHEWHALVGQPLSAGEAGVVMHFDSWLEPSYVSFKHLLLYEGFAPTSNRTGWFLDLDAFPEEFLQHGEGAGMGSGESNRNFGIGDVGNQTLNGDYVGMWIGERQAYYNGSYQLNIPLLWYVEGGEVTNSLPNNVQTAWVYTNATMRVQKNGVTWERTIEGLNHQVIE